MLPYEKNDLLYLLNILEYIGKIREYTAEINCAEELYELNSQMNLNASLTLLANIGENVSKISEEVKNQYGNLDWKSLKNFRNRIVHDYAGLDLIVVYEIITSDLTRLKSDIEQIIADKLFDKIFEMEEIEICRNSEYYKYIDFKNIIK
jgi:uncharacterized protein with HEPN domain